MLYFSNLIDVPIWGEEPILDIRLDEPYKIVCEGLNVVFDSYLTYFLSLFTYKSKTVIIN